MHNFYHRDIFLSVTVVIKNSFTKCKKVNFFPKCRVWEVDGSLNTLIKNSQFK